MTSLNTSTKNTKTGMMMIAPDAKPDFDTQVSALSDRGDGTSSTQTHNHATSKSVDILDPDLQEEPMLVLRSASAASHGSLKTDGIQLKPETVISSGGDGSASIAAASTNTSVTFGGQAELPPLPIPALEETLQKFLQALEALQEDPAERSKTKRSVMDFLNGDGPALQQALLEYDRVGRANGTTGSYVEEFWNDSYLAPDSSVVLNLNPFFVLEDSPDPKLAQQPLKRAASLCFASVKLASQLRFEQLKPDTFKGRALCMDQFKALFSTARVPMSDAKDAIRVFEDSNHVAVMCTGQMYYFQALWPEGHVAVDEGDLVDILTAIHNHAQDEQRTQNPVWRARQNIGVLTSLPRKEWAQARSSLMEVSETNAESIKIIDSALFVLVLDDYIPQNKHDAAANMLHGSYSLRQYQPPSKATTAGTNHSPKSSVPFSDYQDGSCCNRWYDKMQIIVCGDGTAGINFEHSTIDGHTALRFVSDVYAETVISFAQSITKLVAAHDVIPNVITATVRRAATTLDATGRTTLDVFPKKLSLEVPESIQRQIYYAETALGDEIVASETFVLEFRDYGKSFITSHKMSPDSFVQMSMLLAYYQLYGKVVCSYEPVLTKKYYHGRTEAMRPTTMEAKRLCQVFSNPHAREADKIAALRNATKVHSQLVKECACGKGVDRHLFALKCIAEKQGKPVPAFFQSSPWKRLNHTVLSTSNCGNPALAGFGFGPVVADGLGIGYIIKDHQLHYSISSKHRQTRRYAYTLESVLEDMAALFQETSKTNTATVQSSEGSPSHSSQRRHLKHIPLHMVSYDSYGDIWGESTLYNGRKEVGSAKATDSTLDYSATDVAENCDEELPASLRSIPEPSPKRRGSKDFLPVVPGRRGSLASDGSYTSGYKKAAASLAIPHKEMQGQEEPLAPNDHHQNYLQQFANRSDRMVGPFQRHASFEYVELSQKGLQIEMERKDSFIGTRDQLNALTIEEDIVQGPNRAQSRS